MWRCIHIQSLTHSSYLQKYMPIHMCRINWLGGQQTFLWRGQQPSSMKCLCSRMSSKWSVAARSKPVGFMLCRRSIIHPLTSFREKTGIILWEVTDTSAWIIIWDVSWTCCHLLVSGWMWRFCFRFPVFFWKHVFFVVHLAFRFLPSSGFPPLGLLISLTCVSSSPILYLPAYRCVFCVCIPIWFVSFCVMFFVAICSYLVIFHCSSPRVCNL